MGAMKNLRYSALMRKPFLTAHWGNLVLLNYPVPQKILEPHLPQGCELDLFEGSAYLSLVAFQFTRTRVFGLQWPFFTNFPELNLRFYVKHNGNRGVSFVSEFVPSALVAGIARVLYNEPYRKATMHDRVTKSDTGISVDYRVSYQSHALRFQVEAKNEPHLPAEGSLEHFFKEHELGVGRDRNGETVTYDVQHPFWRVFPVTSSQIELDAGGLYGESFAFLSTQKPSSVVLAEGSEIVVYGKNKKR